MGCQCNFACDRQESCEKVRAQHDFIRGVIPLSCWHNVASVVHCRGADNSDGRAAEYVRLLIEEIGHTDPPIHRHCFIRNSAEVEKWIKSIAKVIKKVQGGNDQE